MAGGYEDFFAIAEEALDIGDVEALESLKETMYGNVEFLKTISASFLTATRDTWAKIKNLNEASKRAYKIKKSLGDQAPSAELENALLDMRNLKIENWEFDLFSQAIFKYQASVNLVLGQSVQLIYVYRDENGNPEIWNVSENGNIVTQTMASKGRGLVAKYKNLSSMNTHKEQLKAQIDENDSKGFNTLKNTYLDVVQRGEKSREILKKGFLMIMWLTDRWHVMKVSAMGDVNEAYAAFYLNMLYRENFIFLDKGREYNVETFMTDENYGVGAVDPISGLLQGDTSIQLENGLKLEFAVKSDNASALSFEQVIRLANAIVDSGTEEITMEWLQSYKHDLTLTKSGAEIKGRNRQQNFSKCMENTANQLLLDEMKKYITIPLSS